MRILHILQRYWPARGGAEVYMQEVSSRLAADGHQVTVVTTDALDVELFWDARRGRVPGPTAQVDGVRVLRFPVRHLPRPTLAYPAVRRLLWLLSAARPVPLPFLFHLARWTPWVPGLYRWLEHTGERFDLVGGMNIAFEPLLAAGLAFAQRQRAPFVAYPLTHLGAGARPGEDALGRFYTMRHQVDLVRRSDAAVLLTPAERDFYAAHGMPGERMVVAGPGVDAGQIRGGDASCLRERLKLSGPVVASLSAMTYDKGTVPLVEAVRRLWAGGRQVELVLAGAVMESFQRYLAGLPAADRERLHILGPIGDQEKRDLLATAGIFAMPSRTDSFGIVYLEAWSCGVPVIAAQTWGVSDVISDGRDGLLVPFGDVDRLAEAIVCLLDHPAERAAMGARGAEKVRDLYSWDRTYASVRDLYAGLAGQKGNS